MNTRTKTRISALGFSLIAVVNILPAKSISSASEAPMQTSEVLTLEKKANRSFWARDYKTAEVTVEELLKQPDLSQPLRARCLTNLSICEAQLDDWNRSKKHSAEALKIAAADSLTSADAGLVQARCLLLADQIDKARKLYEQSLNTAIKLLGPWNTDLAPFYEGLAACDMMTKKYPAALEKYKKVAQLDMIKYGPDDTHLAWSLMSVTNVLSLQKQETLSEALYKKMIWNFRYQNENRILSEHKDQAEAEKFLLNLRAQLYGVGRSKNRDSGMDYIRAGIPAEALEKPAVRPQDFDNWFKERVGRERAPGLAFFDPTVPLKGLIVTVHGLGLYGGAYAPFANQIQHEGFGVISFDVRGFGTYRNDEIYQQVDLQAAIGDIKRVLTELRNDYPGMPLILLGESMGGAIVLRIAAEAPELMDAVISSVPSGSRYQGKKTAYEVALKFLRHKHGQFDIGTQIVEQATVSEDLRDMWEGDSEMRMKLSPAELLRFQRFMSENVKTAQKITKTPVIIFQGYSDNLVKPMGTLAIYQAIPNKDKDLLFIGRAEHLIFEEGQFDNAILKTVLEWINRHITATNKKDGI